MCGRFSLAPEPGQLEEMLGVAPPPLEARYNVHPDADILAVRRRPDGRRSAGFVRWGLIPPWGRDPADKGRQINARSETFLDKPTFKETGLRYRCLIPATGFFEWQKGKDGSQPFRIARKDERPLLFAGLFRPTRGEDGEVFVTAAILTRDAWPALRPIHHRMPVMLKDEAAARWLEPHLDADAIKAAIDPLSEDDLTAYPVSRRVNSPAHEGRGLIEPLDGAAADGATPAPLR